MKENEVTLKISENNNALVKDEDKCIKCGKCVSICRNETTVSRMYDLGITKEPICINCGQCAIYCPTEAISERLNYLKVKSLLGKKCVCFSIAPAVRAALGEEFGLNGVNVEGKIVTALKKMKASYVFDVTFAADLTIMEEAKELIDRITNNKKLPMFTSCCPAWIKYVEIFYPEYIDNLSTCKSPMSMEGAMIKSYFKEKNNIDEIIHVSVMPCTAKKEEMKREQLKGDTDYVLTTRELTLLIKENNIDFKNLDDTLFDSPLKSGSSAGVIFGNTGGVMEAALRTAYHMLTNKDLKDDELIFNSVRGMSDIKEALVNINGRDIKVAVCNGTKNAKKLLDNLDEYDYDFIEVMNCNGGCIAGGGQPKTTLLEKPDTYEMRMNCLYNEDNKNKLRVSYKNEDVIKVYNEYLTKEIAHEKLHTSYKDTSYLLKGESKHE